MIEMSPKALRFARLAAHQQPSFAESPQIKVIDEHEARFRQDSVEGRVQKYVRISEEAATFCLDAVRSLLGQKGLFERSEWDGNDFVFLQAVAEDLSRQLGRLDARAV